MAIFEILLGLMGACVALALVARRLNVPPAVVLVLGGMTLALIPGLPTVNLDPQLALVLFLPPLLQASAYRTDWPAFRSNLRPILLLAVGAVLFTALVVAVTAKLLVPSLPWAAAIALGAIVAPPDAVAAASVLKNFRMPKRLVVVLEGESLLNDASSLVLYRFAVGATLVGEVVDRRSVPVLRDLGRGRHGRGLCRGADRDVDLRPSRRHAARHPGVVPGRLRCLSGGRAYPCLRRSGGGGLRAGAGPAAACGLHCPHAAGDDGGLELRGIRADSLVFVLIGLQLRDILGPAGAVRSMQLAGLGIAVSAALILSRFAWVFPGNLAAPIAVAGLVRAATPCRLWSHSMVLSWAGMRGVVSLAAALALPAGFPERDIILFLAFCAILATLVLQGTTLGPLIRR